MGTDEAVWGGRMGQASGLQQAGSDVYSLERDTGKEKHPLALGICSVVGRKDRERAGASAELREEAG